MVVVAGVAIDKGVHENYLMTVEIADISSGKDTTVKSKVLSVEGQTIFDAARNMISISGKKLYWSHAKVIIIGEAMARSGVAPILDWYNRDAETRGDIHVLVSRSGLGRDILETKVGPDEVKSFTLDNLMRNQDKLSKAPQTQIWEFTNKIGVEGVSALAPQVTLREEHGQQLPHIEGTAVFKRDKLIGFLDGEESKALLFVNDEIKGGLLIVKGGTKEKSLVALEIFKNRTKIDTKAEQGNIEMKVNIAATVAIDEVDGNLDVINAGGSKQLERSVERMLKKQVDSIVEKAQSEFKADIFGFGAWIQEDKPEVWDQVGTDWDDIFEDLKVTVTTNIHIRNSAMLSKPIKVGD